MEIENLGAKLEDEGKLEDLKFIYKIKDLLEKIENNEIVCQNCFIKLDNDLIDDELTSLYRTS